MTKSRLRIPKRINLGLDYIVTVLQLPHDQWVAKYLETFNDEDHKEDDAFCVGTSEGMTIYLDKRMPIRVRRARYIHEMLHCVADWQVKVLGTPSVAAHIDLRRKTSSTPTV